jgi:hypothetical protein
MRGRPFNALDIPPAWFVFERVIMGYHDAARSRFLVTMYWQCQFATVVVVWRAG